MFINILHTKHYTKQNKTWKFITSQQQTKSLIKICTYCFLIIQRVILINIRKLFFISFYITIIGLSIITQNKCYWIQHPWFSYEIGTETWRCGEQLLWTHFTCDLTSSYNCISTILQLITSYKLGKLGLCNSLWEPMLVWWLSMYVYLNFHPLWVIDCIFFCSD